MTQLKNNLLAVLVSAVLISGNGLLPGSERRTQLPLIKKDVSTGLSNGGWKYNGGHRAAIIYGLVASCRLCGIDTFAYFRDVLERINTHPASRVAERIPAN